MNKYQMWNIAICITSLCMLASCAHKSGHRRDRERQVSSQKQISAQSTEERPKIEHAPKTRTALEGTEIFERYRTAVFMVFTCDGIKGYQGSGFFISNKGMAVSNYHVFQGTGRGLEQIKLDNSNDVYKVSKVIAKDKDKDFILFTVNCTNTNYIPIAKDRPKVGEKVYAIGSPRGLENTFSSGEVSQWRDKDLMQTNALIDHGSSGGALINEFGEVIGITSGTFADGSQANLNYAWSIEVIKPYL